MNVSVVIATYAMERFEDFSESVESVLKQTYEPVEIVLVIDGNEAVYDRTVSVFGDRAEVVIHCNEENEGLSYSRNRGAELASGDVIAFFDDDAIAEPDWIEELVHVYEETDAIAAGGKILPEWVVGKPWFLPPEFYWLVGVTPPEFAEPGEEVRNTFGSNISFRAEVFDTIEGFNPDVGPKGGNVLQGDESEFCSRMRAELGQGVIYNPDAQVRHKVFDYRADPQWLLVRSFWQGYSKYVMSTVVEDSGEKETAFLKRLFKRSIPTRIKKSVRDRSIVPIGQLVALMAFTVAVGLGYGYGIVRYMISGQREFGN